MSSSRKVALVTGANRNIGFETARQLGQKSITVVIAARVLSSAEEAASKLQAEGIDAFPVKLDVTNAQDRQAVAKTLRERYGKLDILINNASVDARDGIFTPKTIETSEEELQTVFATNLFGVIALTRSLLPLLKKSDAGRIVNVSSKLGSFASQTAPNSEIAAMKAFSYNASKTALNMFTIHLAAELQGTNIKVNSAQPGWVKTELGGEYAPMEIPDGARTSVDLALIGPDGPSGRFLHRGEELPW